MRPVLIKLDVVCSTLEKSPDEVFEMADGGSLLHGSLIWVFNLATNGDEGKRELRFWAGEVLAKRAELTHTSSMSLTAVLESIAPPSIHYFPTGRIESEFQLRRCTIGKLRGEIGQPQGMIPRGKLAAFLASRWLGNSNHGSTRMNTDKKLEVVS